MSRLLRRSWIVLLPLLAGAASWWGLPWLVSLPPALLVSPGVSTRFLARDGAPLRQLLTEDGVRAASPVALAEIPPALVHATLAVEDKRFWHHSGIDLAAIARAAKDNLSAGRVVSGASTVHQQLIKITAQRSGSRTFSVKLMEALQARRLAMSWSREQVLESYLNRLPYGNLFTGCNTAAQGYFDKPLKDLTAAECALLAALPQAPGRLNPFRDLEKIRPRQQYILTRMHQLGWLEDEDYEAAKVEPLRLQRFTGGFAAPHAVELLRASSQGEIRTTLDAALQRKVETIIAQRLGTLRERHVTQAAAVVIENATGNLLALAGSRDFFAPDGGQINGAWVPHSPGSAVKPFTYAIAFERGLTPATLISDLAIEYHTPTGLYRPENYAHRLYGPVTCRMALGNSLNISAVKVLQQIGGAETLLTRLRLLGLSTLTENAEHYGLGLTIGNAPVRLVELANAYACLARLGLDRPWSLVQVTSDASKEPQRQIGESESYLIADILSDNQARLLTFGQNSPLRLPFPAAVKTGTSTSYRDNWAVGYTPEFTVGVWAGNFDNTPMQGVSGVTGAAPIWREIFLDLQHRYGVTWFTAPKELVQARIDPRTGKRLTPQSPPARLSREEWFPPHRLPPPATASDYDAQGRAILSDIYADWIKSGDNWLGDLVVTSRDKSVRSPLKIIHPVPGTVIRLDPDIRDSGNRLILRAEGSGVTWASRTLELRQDAGRWIAILKPGRHEIVAFSDKPDESARTFVIVHEE